MKKSIFVLALLASLSMQTVVFADVAPEPDAFTDVQWGDDYYWEVLWLKDEGIVSGYPDGSYQPESNINRAEFSKIVTLAAENLFGDWAMDTTGFTLDYTDVNSSEWYASYLVQLDLHNVISGYPDGSFQPGNNVNFAEAAKMIMIAYGSGELTSSGEWFEPYVEMLEDLGAVPETITDNGQYITRGEMAEIIYNSAQNR